MLKEGDVVTGEKGEYQIQAKIGSESTFGAVFKALDSNKEPVVIKQLLGESHISKNVGLDYDYTRSTFEREAEILRTHNNPQIVKAFDFFERDEDLILVMEFINGEDLDQVLVKHQLDHNGLPLPEETVVPVGVEICKVVHFIHQLPGQVLFRDMKPRNVMWDAKNRTIKIIDFGTARFMEKSRKPTQALGTPGYSPPEFYNKNESLSFASDVYTIGATLYELSTGELPEELKTPDHFCGQDQALSDGFKKIVLKSLRQKPKDRFQTAEEMGDELSKLASYGASIAIDTRIRNPYPYLSCFCPGCGEQPLSDKSVFCSKCGGKIHVIILRVVPAAQDRPTMDLFLKKQKNLIGRNDFENKIFPDVDLSMYDPECYVSREHCVLERDGVRFVLRALKTTNVTKVNDIVLPPGKSREVRSDDEILMANLKVKFEIKPCV